MKHSDTTVGKSLPPRFRRPIADPAGLVDLVCTCGFCKDTISKDGQRAARKCASEDPRNQTY